MNPWLLVYLWQLPICMFEEVKRLLSSGMLEMNQDYDFFHGYYGPPLCLAAKGGHIEVVQILLDRGANPNKRYFGVWTPLLAAAADGHTILVRLLLDAGADPNIASILSDWTPLHIASANGYEDTVQELLDKGACPKKQTCIRSTPLSLAKLHSHKKVAKIIEGHLKKQGWRRYFGKYLR